MTKKAYFFIDDVIWCMRDITRQRPASIFDNPFMAMLKKPHDLYGMTVQLNLFYRTDFFYGNDEFILAEMTDAYKEEWEANSDWLKLTFHAKQEFPDYPYVNADYADVKENCEAVLNEIRRFAGEKSISHVVIPHWLPISKEGCQALYDCGIRIISPSWGERQEYNGDPSSLPYGHAGRLLQNRKPETMVFTRQTRDKAIASSICSHNHITQEERDAIAGTFKAIKDKETGVYFKMIGGGPTLNLNKVEDLQPAYDKLDGMEFIGTGNHEQYFYEDYYAYQPDMPEKILKMAEILHNKGYQFIVADEMIPV